MALSLEKKIDIYRAAKATALSYRLDGLTQNALNDLEKVLHGTRMELEKRIAKLKSTPRMATSWSMERAKDSLAEVDRLMAGLAQTLGDNILESASAVGSYATGEHGKILSLDGTIPINPVALSPSQFKKMIVEAPAGGVPIPKAVAGAMDRNGLSELQGEILSAMQQGFLTGSSYQRLVRDMSRNFTNLSRGDLTTIVRTTFQTANAQAFEEVYKENKDIVYGKIWTSGNDDRVCMLCLPLNGQFYKYGSKHPPMPRHPRCRCQFRPRTRLWKMLGVSRKAIEDKVDTMILRGRMVDGKWVIPDVGVGGGKLGRELVVMPDGLRAGFTSLAPEVQIAMVGKGRYQLLADGHIKVEDLVNLKTGKLYTIEELRTKAGLPSPKGMPPAPQAAPAPPPRAPWSMESPMDVKAIPSPDSFTLSTLTSYTPETLIDSSDFKRHGIERIFPDLPETKTYLEQSTRLEYVLDHNRDVIVAAKTDSDLDRMVGKLIGRPLDDIGAGTRSHVTINRVTPATIDASAESVALASKFGSSLHRLHFADGDLLPVYRGKTGTIGASVPFGAELSFLGTSTVEGRTLYEWKVLADGRLKIDQARATLFEMEKAAIEIAAKKAAEEARKAAEEAAERAARAAKAAEARKAWEASGGVGSPVALTPIQEAALEKVRATTARNRERLIEATMNLTGMKYDDVMECYQALKDGFASGRIEICSNTNGSVVMFEDLANRGVGRFKNQFELGSKATSGGALCPRVGSSRDGWEMSIFQGVYHKSPLYDASATGKYFSKAGGRERPYYGHLNSNEKPFYPSSQYGPLCMVFDETRVLNRTTFTIGNSCQVYGRNVTESWQMGSLDEPLPLLHSMAEGISRKNSGASPATMKRALMEMIDTSEDMRGFHGYIEAQFHGDLSLDDVKAIVVLQDRVYGDIETDATIQAMLKMAKEADIPVVFYADDHATPAMVREEVAEKVRKARLKKKK